MHCVLHPTFDIECLGCQFAKQLGTTNEAERVQKRKKIKALEPHGEEKGDSGPCRVSLQASTQEMMTAFGDLPVPRDCAKALSDRFGDIMGKGFVCQKVVNALLSLQQEIENGENSNSKWLKLSLGCLIRRDVSEDFQFAGYTFELEEVCASAVLPAFKIPIARDSENTKFTSAELVVRHGCKASPALDRRPRLLLKHLCARGPDLNESYVLAATRRFYTMGFKKGST